MHILFTRFPLCFAYGGAEKQTELLWKGLLARGHKVSFVGSCPVLLTKAKELGIGCVELEIGDPPVTKWGAISFWWRRKTMQQKLVETVASLVSAQDDTCICMVSLSEKLLLTPWATQHGVKSVWIEHDSVGRWLRSNPWLPQLKRLSRQATTVTVSDLSRDLYVQMGWRESDVVAIANGVEACSSFLSDSVAAPTLICATRPESFARRSWSFSAS